MSVSGVRTDDDLLAGRVAGRLIDEHVGEVTKRGAESRVVGPFVAQGGQPSGGQRVIDDTHIHGNKLAGR